MDSMKTNNSFHNSLTRMSPTPFKGVVSLDDCGDDGDMELPERFPLEEKYNNNHREDNGMSDTDTTPLSRPDVTATPIPTIPPTPIAGAPLSPPLSRVRSRKTTSTQSTHKRRHSKHPHHRHRHRNDTSGTTTNTPSKFHRLWRLTSTITSCMGILARLLFWLSAIAFCVAVGWYSYELQQLGTDPHLIAWFSAGAFVLVGFPIAMYGIVMHLANYNEPRTQMYVVRILWMVPIYSMESWLCLRYKDYAIYIETLRDCYESYVLYSFLQYLIHVLGGEEALILMLKDKSPTRGVHMWGLQWCVRPWLMGQPVRRSTIGPAASSNSNNNTTTEALASAMSRRSTTTTTTTAAPSSLSSQSQFHRVHWTSPFFVQCKFGVLQYVLLKILCSMVVAVLEGLGWYHEGDFGWKSGYLYICVVTNTSQCWALYCMIFFYYACKNELASIRPVGKFLSVKALVFFTWWQSVAISMLYQADLIPHYQGGTGMGFGALLPGSALGNVNLDNAIAIDEEKALALEEFGGDLLGSDDEEYYDTISSSSGSSTTKTTAVQQEWTPEDVAKGMQDYLVCIEMFAFAIIHLFVFSHKEYEPKAVQARQRSLMQQPHKDWNKRLGRKWKEWDSKSAWSGTTRSSHEWSLNPTGSGSHNNTGLVDTTGAASTGSWEEDDLLHHPMDRLEERSRSVESDGYDEEDRERKPLLSMEEEDDDVQDNHDSFYSMESSSLLEDNQGVEDDDSSSEANGEFHDEENPPDETSTTWSPQQSSGRPKTGFVKALWDSAIPQDLRDNTVGIIKGDYVVEKKTLLHHAATSDTYDLFSRFHQKKKRPTSIYAKTSEEHPK